MNNATTAQWTIATFRSYNAAEAARQELAQAGHQVTARVEIVADEVHGGEIYEISTTAPRTTKLAGEIR